MLIESAQHSYAGNLTDMLSQLLLSHHRLWKTRMCLDNIKENTLSRKNSLIITWMLWCFYLWKSFLQKRTKRPFWPNKWNAVTCSFKHRFYGKASQKDWLILSVISGPKITQENSFVIVFYTQYSKVDYKTLQWIDPWQDDKWIIIRFVSTFSERWTLS